MSNNKREMSEGLRACLANDSEGRTSDAYLALVKSCYAGGWTLQDIGDAAGVSRERIRQLLAFSVPAELLTVVEPKPPFIKKPGYTRKPSRKVKDLVPEADIQKLTELWHISKRVNGGTPVGDPTREAGDEMAALAMKVLSETGVSIYSLSLALGGSPHMLQLRLARRGLVESFPSVAHVVYKNKQTDLSGHRTRGNTAKSHCKRGHEMSGDNVRFNSKDHGGSRYCRACKNITNLERYHAKKST